jgi:hypothetical protein
MSKTNDTLPIFSTILDKRLSSASRALFNGTSLSSALRPSLLFPPQHFVSKFLFVALGLLTAVWTDTFQASQVIAENLELLDGLFQGWRQ